MAYEMKLPMFRLSKSESIDFLKDTTRPIQSHYKILQR